MGEEGVAEVTKGNIGNNGKQGLKRVRMGSGVLRVKRVNKR